MKPSPIPEAEMFAGHQRVVFSKPEGEEFEEVLPVEVQAAIDDDMGLPMMRVRVELEPGDAERLAAGEPFWLTFWGHMPIFDVAMTEVLPGLDKHDDPDWSQTTENERHARPAPRRIADWEDTSAEPNGIGPVCRHCHELIDSPRDHAPDCWVVTHAK